jgi:hypothetical protein
LGQSAFYPTTSSPTSSNKMPVAVQHGDDPIIEGAGA